jgi:hypothetical protein
LNQLKHGRDSTPSSYHANSINSSLHHLLRFFVSDHKIRVSNVVNIASNRRDFHLGVARAHFVYKLSEYAALLVLKGA